MKTKCAAEIVVGVGVLTWQPVERVSDRYGLVRLAPDGVTSISRTDGVVVLSKCPKEGEYGTLLVEIVESRDSTHIGDLFHGIQPRKTPKGQRLTLGTGKVVRVEHSEFQYIGVNPGRKSQWMDIRALYDCHEHLVKLIFLPDESREKSFVE